MGKNQFNHKSNSSGSKRSRKSTSKEKRSTTNERIEKFMKVHAKAKYLSYEQKRMYSRHWKQGELNTVKMYDEIQKCLKARLVVGAFAAFLFCAACLGIYQLIRGSSSF